MLHINLAGSVKNKLAMRFAVQSSSAPRHGTGGFGLGANSTKGRDRGNSILKHNHLGLIAKDSDSGTEILAFAELVTPMGDVTGVETLSVTVINARGSDAAEK